MDKVAQMDMILAKTILDEVKNCTTKPNIATIVDELVVVCHGAAFAAGWWTNLKTGEDLRQANNVPEKLMLTVSELGEAMEAHRKALQDDHLPDFKGVEVELADAIIRICDLAGAKEYRLGEAIAAKLAYNAQRADHKPENRLKEGGKAY